MVYSDSPNWKEYIETQMLPPIRERVVTLNWSNRSQWKGKPPLEAQLFEHYGGEREYNPMAIIVPRFGRVRSIRFWQAFRDSKHGKHETLNALQESLFDAVRAG